MFTPLFRTVSLLVLVALSPACAGDIDSGFASERFRSGDEVLETTAFTDELSTTVYFEVSGPDGIDAVTVVDGNPDGDLARFVGNVDRDLFDISVGGLKAAVERAAGSDRQMLQLILSILAEYRRDSVSTPHGELDRGRVPVSPPAPAACHGLARCATDFGTVLEPVVEVQRR